MATKVKFTKVAKESSLPATSDSEDQAGSLYFVTETGNIYLDGYNVRHKMTPEYKLTTEDNGLRFTAIKGEQTQSSYIDLGGIGGTDYAIGGNLGVTENSTVYIEKNIDAGLTDLNENDHTVMVNSEYLPLTSSNSTTGTVIVGGNGARPNLSEGTNATIVGANTSFSATNNTVVGTQASATGDNASAIGAQSEATGVNSVALGYNSKATDDDVISVGNNEESLLRKITGVFPATLNKNDGFEFADADNSDSQSLFDAATRYDLEELRIYPGDGLTTEYYSTYYPPDEELNPIGTGVTVTHPELSVKYDNSTIGINSNNQLTVVKDYADKSHTHTKDEITDLPTVKDGVSVTASDTFYILATSQPKTPTGAADPSGWSKTEPTPADTYTGNEYRCIRTTLSDGTALWTTPTVVASFSFAQKAYSTAAGTASKWSKIDKTIEEYNSTYGTDYETIDGVLLKMSSNIKQNSDGITLKADSDTVVGANLMTGTRDFDKVDGADWNNIQHWTKQSETYKGLTVYAREEAWTGLSTPEHYEAGTYTWSCYAKASAKLAAYFFTNDDNSATYTNWGRPEVSTEWSRISVTFEAEKAFWVPRLESGQSDITLYICGIKLEKGTVATPWCATAEELTTSAQLKIESGRITEEVSGKYATKDGLSTLTNTVTTLDKSTTRQFKEVYSTCSAPNLAAGSSNGKGWECTAFADATGEGNGHLFARSTTGTGECFIARGGLRLELGKTYTLSGYVRTNGYVKDVELFAYDRNVADIHSASFDAPTSWTLMSLTFTPKADSAYDWSWGRIRFDNNGSTSEGTEAILYVKDIKLEEGSHATPWCMPDADVPSTLIHENSDGISVGKGTQAADGTVTWTSGQFHTLQGNGTFQVQDASGNEKLRVDNNRYLYTNYINSDTGNNENPAVSQIIVTNGNDNYYRKASASHVISSGLTKDHVTTALGYTPPTTNTTYSAATTSAAGLMSAADKTKLNGIAAGANAYSLPTATSTVLGGVKVGSNITLSSGVISLTKSNVTTALGYTPATAHTIPVVAQSSTPSDSAVKIWIKV